MLRQIKNYNDFDIPAERIQQYQAMPMEKGLEWLYLGNLLRKAFHEMMDNGPLEISEIMED